MFVIQNKEIRSDLIHLMPIVLEVDSLVSYEQLCNKRYGCCDIAITE